MEAENTFFVPSARQFAKVANQTDLVGRGVTHSHGCGVAAMGCHQRGKAAIDFGIGFFPGGGLKHAIALDERSAQAVRVVVQVFQSNGLGADVARAQHVGIVAPDAADLAPFKLDLQPAASFTQGANAVMGGGGHGDLGSGSW